MIWNRKASACALAMACIFVGWGASGCSTDDGDETQGDGDSHTDDVPEECAEISTACHDVDTLTTEAADCHHIAHENVKGDCAEALAECVSHCESLAGAGAGGAGGDGGATSEDH